MKNMPSIADFCRIDPGRVQGIIDVTILVGISYASFENLQSQFLEDLSQALQIDHSQVRKLVVNVYICTSQILYKTFCLSLAH
jgi:hypothetical protein